MNSSSALARLAHDVARSETMDRFRTLLVAMQMAERIVGDDGHDIAVEQFLTDRAALVDACISEFDSLAAPEQERLAAEADHVAAVACRDAVLALSVASTLLGLEEIDQLDPELVALLGVAFKPGYVRALDAAVAV